MAQYEGTRRHTSGMLHWRYRRRRVSSRCGTTYFQ